MKKLNLIELDEHYLLSGLNEIMMFSYLNQEEKKEVLKISDILEFEKGEKIISEGDINPYLYAVIEGCVEVSKGGKHLSSIKKGDVFGEAGIFINMQRTADVLTLESSQVVRLERNKLFRFFKNHSDAGVRMLMIMTYSLLNKLKERHHEQLSVDTGSSVEKGDLDDYLKT